MPTDIRVGIVGAGANTTDKHIPLLQEIDGVEIMGEGHVLAWQPQGFSSQKAEKAKKTKTVGQIPCKIQ